MKSTELFNILNFFEEMNINMNNTTRDEIEIWETILNLYNNDSLKSLGDFCNYRCNNKKGFKRMEQQPYQILNNTQCKGCLFYIETCNNHNKLTCSLAIEMLNYTERKYSIKTLNEFNDVIKFIKTTIENGKEWLNIKSVHDKNC